MILGQKPTFRAAASAVAGLTLAAGFVASAQPVTVTDVTDWNTTPMEVVTISDPYLNYYGGVYAGINNLSVNTGTSTAVFDGFCIDPFHWSVSGPQSYDMVPLADAPKLPGTLNAATATDIGDLWAEYFSPTMTAQSAAGLQIAIWELVSSNAVASGNLPGNEAFSLAPGQSDYGAGADIDSLATYSGPSANVAGLTGPGQDYAIDPVPDGGETLWLLAFAAGILIFGRVSLGQGAALRLQPARVPTTRENQNHPS